MEEKVQRSNAGKGIGIAGFVISIVALIIFWFPILGIVLGVLALVFSIIGISAANKHNRPKGFPVAGMIISIISIIIAVLWITVIASMMGFIQEFSDDKLDAEMEMYFSKEFEDALDEIDTDELEKQLEELGDEIDEATDEMEEAIKESEEEMEEAIEEYEEEQEE